MQEPFRIPPARGPEYYKSYAVHAPLTTHWRPATCEEFECDDYVLGFTLRVDMSTELGQRQYEFVTHDKTRSYRMERYGFFMVDFHFPPGTRGFEGPKHDHKIHSGRPPHLLVHNGDWRGSTLARTHQRYEDWVDDFANHQIGLQEEERKG